MAKRRGRPFAKGHVKLGGRTRGTPNRGNPEQEARKKAAEEEIRAAKEAFEAAMAGELRFTPLQVMNAVMLLRIGQGDHEGALEAARDAAPYVHAKLNAAEVRVQHSIVNRSDAELTAEIETIRAKIARSKASARQIEGTAQAVETSAPQADSPETATAKGNTLSC